MKQFENILILGVSGGIGAAFSREMRTRFPAASISGTSRDPSSIQDPTLTKTYKLDVLDENDWQALNQTLDQDGMRFDLIISTIGVLEVEAYGPEKNLKSVDLKKVSEIFQVNAISSMMVGKHVLPFLQPTVESCVVFLSAMVGSIGENQMGGWYSYRSSKAALNMIVKNMAIEYSRKRAFSTKFLLLHPGTTETQFSKKYLKGVRHKVWKPDGCVKNLLAIITDYTFDSGDFRNWDNRIIEW